MTKWAMLCISMGSTFRTMRVCVCVYSNSHVFLQGEQDVSYLVSEYLNLIHSAVEEMVHITKKTRFLALAIKYKFGLIVSSY